tara:strand:+ start:271 stop:624 length:354 start_codon:yes stop_codon:yes gene_type:complete
MYAEVFHEFKDPVQRQNVVAALVMHVGSNNCDEVDSAMHVLTSLTTSSSSSSLLKPYAAFIASLLDSLADLTMDQARRLFMILFSANEDDSTDHVHIVIRKVSEMNVGVGVELRVIQ